MGAVLKAEFDVKSLEKQFKKLAEDYGDSQKQAIKRWGVATARQLAIVTQAFGKAGAKQKKAMFYDALNVVRAHKGKAMILRHQNIRIFYDHRGRATGIDEADYLTDLVQIDKWIQKNRKRANRRTVKLNYTEKKVTSEAKLRKVVNARYKKYAGQAKDGWMDAGDHIGRSQKGTSREKIGVSYIKWARKEKKNGKSKETGRKSKMQNFGYLINKIRYTKKDYVLASHDANKAVYDAGKKTMTFYRKSIKARNKVNIKITSL